MTKLLLLFDDQDSIMKARHWDGKVKSHQRVNGNFNRRNRQEFFCSAFVIERQLSGACPHKTPGMDIFRNGSAKVIVELSASRR